MAYRFLIFERDRESKPASSALGVKQHTPHVRCYQYSCSMSHYQPRRETYISLCVTQPLKTQYGVTHTGSKAVVLPVIVQESVTTRLERTSIEPKTKSRRSVQYKQVM